MIPHKQHSTLPLCQYEPPIWLGTPSLNNTYSIELMQSGSVIHQQSINKHNYYIIQRHNTDKQYNTIFIPDGTVSRQHAVLLYDSDHSLYIYDCGSTHGTVLNKQNIRRNEYIRVYGGDHLRFGLSNILCVIESSNDETRPIIQITQPSVNSEFNDKLQQKLQQSRSVLKSNHKQLSTVNVSVNNTANNGNDNEVENDDSTNTTASALYVLDDGAYALRAGVSVTTAQQRVYDTYKNKLNKLTQSQTDIDRLNEKQDQQHGELTDGQQRALQSHTNKLQGLCSELQQCEEQLLNIFNAGGLQSLNNAYNNDSDDDDYFDRTQTNTVKQTQAHTITDDIEYNITQLNTIESLQQIMKQFEHKRNLLRNNLRDIAVQQHTTIDTTSDTLDNYMQYVNQLTYHQRKHTIKHELQVYQSQYIECDNKLKQLQAEQRSRAIIQQYHQQCPSLTQSTNTVSPTNKPIVWPKSHDNSANNSTAPAPAPTHTSANVSHHDDGSESFLTPSAFNKLSNNLQPNELHAKLDSQRNKYDVHKRIKLQGNSDIVIDSNQLGESITAINWQKPVDQDGTGRISLNDKYGY